MKIVGFVGPKRSGKSTAAAALVQQRGFVEVGFADAVKELALRINPMVTSPADGYMWRLSAVVRDHGWERAKDDPEVRRFLQELGTGVRDTVGEDSWIEAFARRWIALGKPNRIVVPDVRFTNEAEELRGSDALLVRVTRPGLDLSDAHVSETEQAGIECDVEIVNDQNEHALQVRVLNAVAARLG